MVVQLLDRHERQIRKFLARRSGPLVLKRTTLDDLYHETAAAALGSAHNVVFRNDAHFFAWVAVIARRVISGELTHEGRRPNYVRLRSSRSSGFGIPESAIVSPRRTPSSSAAGREHATRLRDAIGGLPDSYRRAITLYKLDELALVDVAQQLGKSTGATCRLVTRALKELRCALVDA